MTTLSHLYINTDANELANAFYAQWLDRSNKLDLL